MSEASAGAQDQLTKWGLLTVDRRYITTYVSRSVVVLI
jgi:hypothetical protein